jgi:hypothetical protein
MLAVRARERAEMVSAGGHAGHRTVAIGARSDVGRVSQRDPGRSSKVASPALS